jgi:hypothetical protein
MKGILLIAALGLGATFTPAFACDWNKEASTDAPVVTACAGNGCATEQTTGESTTSQPAEPAATEKSPAPNAVACASGPNCATEDEPPTSSPTTLACQGTGC